MCDIHQKISTIMHKIVLLLARGDFDSVEELSKGVRLKAHDIKHALDAYGQQLDIPPQMAFENLDIVSISDVRPQRWSVRFNLRTKEEGQSGLSLEVTLIDKNDGSLDMEIDDIHVL